MWIWGVCAAFGGSCNIPSPQKQPFREPFACSMLLRISNMLSTLQEERLECRGFLRPIDFQTRCVAPSCKLILDTTWEPGMQVTLLLTMATPNLGMEKPFHKKKVMPHSHL